MNDLSEQRFEERLRARLAHPAMPPLFAAVGAWIATTIGVSVATGVWIATTVIMSAAAIGLSFISRALMGKPKFDAGNQLRSFTGTVRQPAAPRRMVYGFMRTGGIISFLHLTGANNEFMHLVITFTGREIDHFGGLYFDGVLVPLDGGGDATGTFAGFVHVEFKTGAAGEAAFPGLIAASGGLWTVDHKQEGCASIYVRLKYDADKFASGLPNVTAEIYGHKVYDPRDASTAYSNNWALCVRDYLTAALGCRIPAARMNDDSFIAAANVSDEAVALAAGGAEPRYQCNGVLELGNGWDTDLNNLLTAGAGALVPGGMYSLYAGAWRASSLSLGDEDLYAALEVQELLSRRDLCNAVRGTYISPDNKWELSDFPGMADAAAIAEDGGEVLWTDVQFPFTTSKAAAQRLAKIELQRTRRQATVSSRHKLKAWQLVAGDTADLTHARFGWANKTFFVNEVKLAVVEDDPQNPVLGVDTIQRETDAAIYDWSTADEAAVDVVAAVTLPNASAVAPPTALHLVSGDATALAQSDGSRITRIRANWTAPADQFVVSGGKIQAQYKKSADADWSDLPLLDGAVTEMFVSPVSDGVAYDVRVRGVNVSGASSAWAEQDGHIASQGVGTAAAGCVRPSAFVDTGTLLTSFPTAVYDTDLETSASIVGGNTGSPRTGQCAYSGFPAIAGMATAVLKLKSELVTSGTPPFGRLRYSLDSGATWTTVYDQDSDYLLTTDSIPLLASQDLTHIRVDARVLSSTDPMDNGSLNVYDARVEYTLT